MGQIKKDSCRAECQATILHSRLVFIQPRSQGFSAEEETTMRTIQKFTKHALRESSSFLQQIKADLIHVNGLN